MDKGVDDSLGFLRGGSVIEIHERLPVDLHSQDREVRADFEDIEPRRLFRRFNGGRPIRGSVHPTSFQCLSFASFTTASFTIAPFAGAGLPSGNDCRTIAARYSRTAAQFMRSRDSPAKAKSNNRRAEASSIPRERM